MKRASRDEGPESIPAFFNVNHIYLLTKCHKYYIKYHVANVASFWRLEMKMRSFVFAVVASVIVATSAFSAKIELGEVEKPASADTIVTIFNVPCAKQDGAPINASCTVRCTQAVGDKQVNWGACVVVIPFDPIFVNRQGVSSPSAAAFPADVERARAARLGAAAKR